MNVLDNIMILNIPFFIKKITWKILSTTKYRTEKRIVTELCTCSETVAINTDGTCVGCGKIPRLEK